MTKAEIKNEVNGNLETIRGLRHGFRVSDLSFCAGVESAVATVALRELVDEGVLVVLRKAGRVNVYGLA